MCIQGQLMLDEIVMADGFSSEIGGSKIKSSSVGSGHEAACSLAAAAEPV